MIRRSLLIAFIALLLSIGGHLLGIGIAVGVDRTAPPPETIGNAVALGNAFEDIAEIVEEAVEPEQAPEPEQEQPVEPVPPTSEATVPETEVLVASENPQESFAPDTGTAQLVEPVPLAGTDGDFVPEPDITEPTAQPDDAEPVPPQNDTPPSLGVETDTVEAVDPVLAQAPTPPVPTEPTEPVEDVIASLPETLLPIAPVTPLSEPETEIIADPDPVDPPENTPEEPLEDSAEDAPKPLFPGLDDGFENLRNPTQSIESPLETFKREGSLATVGGFGIQSGSAANSRGPGNADTTNYAGRVLVHLNRTRPVHVKTPGFARVLFEINPDGSLNWVEVIDSSGSADVNRAARIQIQSAAPFPKPPNGVRRQLSFAYRAQ
ncbi:TonB family protein [Shimia thalassica]|uniref:cell envelope integrity protein TolA n=1 Tax=Shimia thalassica TaxID=1715693 RepID=UPI0027354110|nr:TonB family protein [Shimia thalassica]MDP2495992.1 TonB family protein [Shimia thalassica]